MEVININNKRKSHISYAILYLAGQISNINNKVRTYGTDAPLHEAEIHMIKAISNGAGISVTELAEKLEVTKGAVSQILNRLNKKGMILKSADPKNLSRLSLSLTEKGECAGKNHALLHEKFDACVASALAGADEKEKEFLLKFLNRLNAEMEKFEEDVS